MLLFGLSSLSLLPSAHVLRSAIGQDAVPRELSVPWWAWPILFLVALGAAVLGTVVLKYLFEFFEYLAIAWRKCPACGARRWSWGYTGGFGL
jgi:hypothetical protein